jgi:hypothetical protein
LELGGNCWFVALLLGRDGFRIGVSVNFQNHEENHFHFDYHDAGFAVTSANRDNITHT